ncbi:MAG: hypothetical protein J0I06_18245, partial [Planctomycetes bacterium]|nr:hypothetical protein [Planctomycetota bacterium]
MFCRLSAVVKDFDVIAPGILKGIGKDGHRRKVAGLVHLPGERQRSAGSPLREERGRAERVAEDVTENS